MGRSQSDRLCIGPYALTGIRLAARMTPEWKLRTADSPEGMEPGEIEAVTECVRAFLVYRPQKPLRFFVGWCANDYQIDVGTPAGRAEYKRVIDRAAEMGAEYVLFAPANSAVSRREDSADDWSWEYVLWLGMGQKIRRGEWDPKSGAMPPSVQEMLDYARSKKVKLAAYVYPVLPFSQNREWLVTGSKFHTKKQNASLGVRSLQDFLIDNLQAFHRRTGIGGYAFDYTFLWYEGTSRYAQWWGWRRVMETLREKIPDIAIDGRQLYQEYGPWSWLAGSYPHPTGTDEQPESFVPFPDLHFDRVSADRQRYTAYRYRNFEFAPSEIVPGFIGHQSPRMVDDETMPTTSFRARDWDYLGWKYSLLSSIATAGWNNVLNMIPARDPEEYKNFSAVDKQWFRKWLDWADNNREFLRHTRTILGQPAIGRVDGTAAIVGNRGYVFLFNPNYRQLAAEFNLDQSIGLARQDSFRLKEIYPREGHWLGEFGYGDRVSLPVEGTQALVFEIVPAAPATLSQPIIETGSGRAKLSDGILTVTGVQGRGRHYRKTHPARARARQYQTGQGQWPGAGLRADGQHCGRYTALRRRNVCTRSASRHLRSQVHRWDFQREFPNPRQDQAAAQRPQESLADSVDARRSAHHVARPGKALTLRPHRRAGRQNERSFENRRRAGGVAARLFLHPRACAVFCRILRRRFESGSGQKSPT